MDFRKELEALLAQVPPGRVVSYGTLARALGDVAASRAVARMITHSIVEGPLHRAVKADGSIPSGRDRRLLEGEGVELQGGRVPAGLHIPPEDLACRPVLLELRKEQEKLRQRLRIDEEPGEVEAVGGVDLAYLTRSAIAACVVTAKDGSEVRETATAAVDDPFPYIPGYLAYREGEGVHRVLQELSAPPDVLLLDGHGILHPAGFGLACHVGVVEGLRTVGVAKSLLVGTLKSPPQAPSAAAEVLLDGEVKGYAVRPPTSARLLYVSPGHRMAVKSSLEVVRDLLIRSYPEPLRLAHNAATAERRGLSRRAAPPVR